MNFRRIVRNYLPIGINKSQKSHDTSMGPDWDIVFVFGNNKVSKQFF